MMKPLFSLLFLALIFASAQSRSAILHPKPLSSPKINATENAATCFFSYTIRTSCSSPRYTRDHISVSFGDASGNKISASKLEDPDWRNFLRCASDTFDLYGPCTGEICYVYLYRHGSDGWIPRDVTVNAYNRKPAVFQFNVNIPNDTWYGFNRCSGKGSASAIMK